MTGGPCGRIEASLTPSQRSVHQVLHDLDLDHGESWIDGHGWDRLATALIARGWSPPATVAPAPGIVHAVSDRPPFAEELVAEHPPHER